MSYKTFSAKLFFPVWLSCPAFPFIHFVSVLSGIPEVQNWDFSLRIGLQETLQGVSGRRSQMLLLLQWLSSCGAELLLLNSISQYFSGSSAAADVTSLLRAEDKEGVYL